MEITHAVSLLLGIIFVIMAVVFRKFLWWLLVIGYTVCLSWFAVINDWEVMMFVPMLIFGIASCIGIVSTVVKGEWL